MTPEELEGLEKAWQKKQTPEDLRLLAELSATPFWPPLRQILQRMQVQGLDALMDANSSDLAALAKVRGKVGAARELLHFLEVECPRAYENHRRNEAARSGDGPRDERRKRTLRGRAGR